MNPDDFENKLKGQPLKKLPDEWRSGILSAARTAGAAHSSSSSRAAVAWFPALIDHISSLLWPAPKAWAGLAAAWGLILFFNLNQPTRPDVLAKNLPSFQSERIVSISEHRQEVAQLLQNL